MGLDALVRSGIAIAKSITGSLQADVVHAAWTGSGGDGAATYATGVVRPALIEYRSKLIRSTTGAEVMQRALVTFLEPIDADGATGRREPIDPRDRITLPDGTTGPVLEVKGLTDPTTSHPYLFEVSLGYPLAR